MGGFCSIACELAEYAAASVNHIVRDDEHCDMCGRPGLNTPCACLKSEQPDAAQ
jgi:hypothetical protein